MSRSNWKTKQDFSTSYKKFFIRSINVYKRNEIILEAFLNKNIKVYSGKVFKTFKITRDKLGFQLGEFSFTRSLYKSKKNRKKSKKK